MNKHKFAVYNVVGSMLWVGSMLVAGHFLQTVIMKEFDFDLKEHLEVIVLGIIVVTTFPVLWKVFAGNKKMPPVD
jgi:membrane-associated protein